MTHQRAIISDQDMETKLQEFQEWIHNQPELPQNIEKFLLLRYLKTYSFKVDKAQKLLKFSFEMRQKHPEIFFNRDPMSDEIQKILKATDIIELPKSTPENYSIVLLRLADFDPNSFDFNNAVKLFFMMNDIYLINPENNELCDGFIPIYDMKGVTYRHLTKIVFSTLNMFMKYTQDAIPLRVKQLHILNCSSVMDKLYSITKPLLNREVANMIQLHLPGSENIYKFVPKELFPEEYGGSGPSMKELKAKGVKKFESHRNYLNNDANWTITKDLNNNEIKNVKKGGFMGFFGKK